MAKILKFKRRQETNFDQREKILRELQVKTTQAVDEFIDRFGDPLSTSTPELNKILIGIYIDFGILLQAAGLGDIYGDDDEE